MRVAIVASLRAVNSVYRALPLQMLRERGHEVHVDAEAQALLAGGLQGADVVHVYRQHTPGVRRALRQLRDAGVAIVWDNDDHVEPPQARKGEPLSRQAHTQHRQMLELAHVVTTTSPVLAEQYRAWGAERVRVVENYLPDSWAAAAPARGDGVVVGWTAAGEHVHDLRRLGLRAALERLLATHPEVRVESIGIPLGIPSRRYRHTKIVEYRELATRVAAFDVGIAPIADIPFNRARSNVKLKEYAAVGVPWLASPIGPYAGMGEQQGGRLVADDRWFEELSRLVADLGARMRLSMHGLRWAGSERARSNAGAWEAPLQEAVEQARVLALGGAR